MATEQIILDIRAQVADAKRDIAELKTQVGGVNKEVNQTNQLFSKAAGTVAALFSVAAIAGFTKKIIEVRAEFEKYNAVLKNTLGSAEAANIEFTKIQEFASQTPFSVRELTNAFVKLVNQGFRPTTEEMRKLGDIAASTGKSFDQLTEAIIDATVGEFERLKEFGIRAKKAGDQVTFTFKEVERQVDFTSRAIRDYILSLGDAVGVSGAMEEISKTLGGRISNLGDSWDTFLDTMGNRTGGVFKFVIDKLGELIDQATLAAQTAEEVAEKARMGVATESLELDIKAFREWEEENRGRFKTAEEAALKYTEFMREKVNTETTKVKNMLIAAEKSGGKLFGVVPTEDIQVDEYIIRLDEIARAIISTGKKIDKEREDRASGIAEMEFKSLMEEAKRGGAVDIGEDDGSGILSAWMFPRGFKSTMDWMEKSIAKIVDRSWEIYKEGADRGTEEMLKQRENQLEIDKKYADAAIQIELWKQETKLVATESGFSALMAVTSENATLQKILAIAESIISTYVTAQYAAQSQAAIPIIGPILAEAARADAITRGWINTALISAVSIAESFDEGGVYRKFKIWI